jgi:hypothetical protein
LAAVPDDLLLEVLALGLQQDDPVMHDALVLPGPA